MPRPYQSMFEETKKHPIVVYDPGRGTANALRILITKKGHNLAFFHVLREAPDNQFRFEAYDADGNYPPVDRHKTRTAQEVLGSLDDGYFVLIARVKQHPDAVDEPYFIFQGRKFFLGSPFNFFEKRSTMGHLSIFYQIGATLILRIKDLDLRYNDDLGDCFVVMASKTPK